MYLELGGLKCAKQLILFLAYYEQDSIPKLTTHQRNQQIQERYKQGERISDLARQYGISPQRVDQILIPNLRKCRSEQDKS
jgi:Mor family transcriptional regulator